MTMRISSAAALALLFAAATAAAPQKPNLIMFLQDDLGHNDVGFNGNTGGRGEATSNITALARDGIVLAHHYTHWHCSPTRRSFLSGRLPVHHHEQLSNVATDDIDLRYSWISKKLESAGYTNYW